MACTYNVYTKVRLVLVCVYLSCWCYNEGSNLFEIFIMLRGFQSFRLIFFYGVCSPMFWIFILKIEFFFLFGITYVLFIWIRIRCWKFFCSLMKPGERIRLFNAVKLWKYYWRRCSDGPIAVSGKVLGRNDCKIADGAATLS